VRRRSRTARGADPIARLEVVAGELRATIAGAGVRAFAPNSPLARAVQALNARVWAVASAVANPGNAA
jgi:hypothetical protein